MMVKILGIGIFVAVVFFKLEPLMAIALAVLLYFGYKKYMLGEMLRTLEYWKAREFELKAQIAENKEIEKERRVRIREARAKHRTKVTRTSKQTRLMEKFFTLQDRANLKKMPPATRAEAARQLGLNPETLEAWLVLSDAQLEKRKLGLDEMD
jgi:hypothetical protein